MRSLLSRAMHNCSEAIHMSSLLQSVSLLIVKSIINDVEQVAALAGSELPAIYTFPVPKLRWSGSHPRC